MPSRAFCSSFSPSWNSSSSRCVGWTAEGSPGLRLTPDTVPVVAGPVEELFALEFAPPVLPSFPVGGMGPVEAAPPVGLTLVFVLPPVPLPFAVPAFTFPVPVALFCVPETGGGAMAPLG